MKEQFDYEEMFARMEKYRFKDPAETIRLAKTMLARSTKEENHGFEAAAKYYELKQKTKRFIKSNNWLRSKVVNS